MWASGARMNSRNVERLTYLERMVTALGSTPSERRDKFLGPAAGGGRSLFQRLLMAAATDRHSDVGALIESTGAGYTIHGEFLSAEPIPLDNDAP